MEKGVTFSPDLSGKALRFGIVVARWNAICTTALKEQIIRGLQNRGVEEKDIVIYEVPGSYELVYGAKRLIEKENVDAIIPIGVLIKGETMHFEYISDAVTRGCMDLQMQKNIPIIFGILTCLNQEQALARSVGEKSHGDSWAATAIEMACLGE
ncbi:MAG: 6,7-dimethyl-8-ribityllumazine synthase [Candidatus Magasanikbacteria bacterium]|nr:6,7-dimethyl-8-ribityllumazine synthase [Candidatus Magasanikbacteria bacterium]|tara:strand:+ start:3514 stop:3975 length:462 start_codon:yes stop_codon:yes gene_type:complete